MAPVDATAVLNDVGERAAVSPSADIASTGASQSTPPPRALGVTFWLAAGWIAVLLFVAVFADLLPVRDPDALGIRTREVEKFERPGWNAPFGGDGVGHDQFARVIAGTRPALIIGISVTLIGGLIGMAVGLASGYLRGKLDAVSALLIDMALAFPGLVLVIAVRAAFGNSIYVFVALFSVASVPAYARIVRGATLSLSERAFVDVAQAMGASKLRILWRELAPNIAVPALAFAFIGFALVIVAEGGLAFVGLSLDQITWGQLIADGTGEINEHPHVSLIPATVMFLTILSFNLVGDGIRSHFAPREVATRRRFRTEGPPSPSSGGSTLRVDQLRTTLHTQSGDVRVVDDVSFELDAGDCLAIVGESGSGKTMMLRSIVGAFALADVTRSGTVEVEGTDMLRIAPDELRSVLGSHIGMVPQNPLTALNPVRRIETQIIEPMRAHRSISKSQARAEALELMQHVGIPDPERRLRDYPHQLSGGMRQRITIAIALANQPKLLLADEPTTALDVTVQDQILRLLLGLQRDLEMAMILVTHDLAVVRGFADRVAIAYGGQLVESGTIERIFNDPKHRYTAALLSSVPDLELEPHSRLVTIEGQPPPLIDPSPGCRFAPRCPAATDLCHTTEPERTDDEDRWFRCHFPVTGDAEIETAGSRSTRPADAIRAETQGVN